MLQGPFQDVGDDLHVLMAVHPEALARLHSVFIDDPQRTEAHVGRVVVGVEGKGMLGIQPAVVGMAPFGSPPHMDRLFFQFVYR